MKVYMGWLGGVDWAYSYTTAKCSGVVMDYRAAMHGKDTIGTLQKYSTAAVVFVGAFRPVINDLAAVHINDYTMYGAGWRANSTAAASGCNIVA